MSYLIGYDITPYSVTFHIQRFIFLRCWSYTEYRTERLKCGVKTKLLEKHWKSIIESRTPITIKNNNLWKKIYIFLMIIGIISLLLLK